MVSMYVWEIYLKLETETIYIVALVKLFTFMGPSVVHIVIRVLAGTYYRYQCLNCT